MDFAMSWYSFIFPNTALVTATFAVATALQGNTGFRVLGCILTVLLIATWGWVFGMMVRAVVLKQILWPEMQEDRDEGGWKRVAVEAQRREGRGKGRRRGRGQAQLDQEDSTVTRRPSDKGPVEGHGYGNGEEKDRG